MEDTIICAPIWDVRANERSCKKRKKSTSVAKPLSTYKEERHGRCVPRPRRRSVVQDDKYSHQKMRIEHAQNKKPLALRRSSRLSQNLEDRKCLPERAPGVVSGDISGRIQYDSTDDRAGAAGDEIVSIMNSPHFLSDKRETTIEFPALEPQPRDDIHQMKIIPCLDEAKEDRLKCNQGSISPTYHNEQIPKALNNNTGNIPTQSYDGLDTGRLYKTTVAIFDDISEYKFPNASLSVREKSPKVSDSKNEMIKKDTISLSTTAKATLLPGIKSLQPDMFMGQEKNHESQGRLSDIGLRDLHERSLQPRFIYETARWKEVQAQPL